MPLALRTIHDKDVIASIYHTEEGTAASVALCIDFSNNASSRMQVVALGSIECMNWDCLRDLLKGFA